MKRFNRGQIGTALRNFFRVDGDLSLGLEEVIGVDMPLTGALDETPFVRFSVPVAIGAGQGAVAATNSLVAFVPGAAYVLDIRQLIFFNNTAGAKTYRVALVTNTQLLTWLNTAQTFFRDLSSGNIASAQAISRSSYAFTGTVTPIANVGVLALIRVPADNTVIWTPPGSLAQLWGNDPAGAPAIAVFNDVVNQAVDEVACWGREWQIA